MCVSLFLSLAIAFSRCVRVYESICVSLTWPKFTMPKCIKQQAQKHTHSKSQLQLRRK